MTDNDYLITTGQNNEAVDQFHTEEALLGTRLAACRIEANVTQAEIAKEAGLSKHYVSAIERGLHKCNAKTLIAYAKTCNMSLDYIVGLPDGTNIMIELKEKISSMDIQQQQRLLEFLKVLKD